jgi:hypothetical protein
MGNKGLCLTSAPKRRKGMYFCRVKLFIMRSFIASIAAVVLLASCTQTPAEEVVVYDYFGDSAVIGTPVLTGAEVLKQLETSDSIWVTFQAPIQAVCQTKGCWMEVQLDSATTALVRFKDYGFFVPMDASGEMATIGGAVKKQELSVEWLQEQARDANEPDSVVAAITKPEVRLTVMASGVALPQKEVAEGEPAAEEAGHDHEGHDHE